MGAVNELPVMTLRDVVLYPGAESGIYVGRDVTMASVRAARDQYEGRIAVVTQRVAAQNDGVVTENVYAFGTLCHVDACIELRDNSMKLMLSGLERIALERLYRTPDGAGMAVFTPAPEPDVPPEPFSPAANAALRAAFFAWQPRLDDTSELPEWKALRAATDTATAARLARALGCTPRLKEDTRSGFIVDEATARRQKILEADDPALQLALVVEALSFDILQRA